MDFVPDFTTQIAENHSNIIQPSGTQPNTTLGLLGVSIFVVTHTHTSTFPLHLVVKLLAGVSFTYEYLYWAGPNTLNVTVVRNGVGSYTITYGATAPAIPIVLITIATAIGYGIIGSTNSTTAVQINTFNTSNVATDMNFYIEVLSW